MYFDVYVCACDDAWLLLLLMLSVRFCSCCCCCCCWCYCHAIYNAGLSLVVLLCACANASLSILNVITTIFAPIFVNVMNRHQSSFQARNLTILAGMHTFFIPTSATKNRKNTYVYAYVEYPKGNRTTSLASFVIIIHKKISTSLQACRVFVPLSLVLHSMFDLCNVHIVTHIKNHGNGSSLSVALISMIVVGSFEKTCSSRLVETKLQ